MQFIIVRVKREIWPNSLEIDLTERFVREILEIYLSYKDSLNRFVIAVPQIKSHVNVKHRIKKSFNSESVKTIKVKHIYNSNLRFCTNEPITIPQFNVNVAAVCMYVCMYVYSFLLRHNWQNADNGQTVMKTQRSHGVQHKLRQLHTEIMHTGCAHQKQPTQWNTIV